MRLDEGQCGTWRKAVGAGGQLGIWQALNVAATAATLRATNLLHVQALQTFPFIGHKKPTLTAIVFRIFTIFTVVDGNVKTCAVNNEQ